MCSHMVLRMCGGCGEALPKVMSCLPSGLRGNPALLGAALYIGWRCEGLGPRYRGCQHSLQHSNKVYRHTTHTHTHAYQSWPQHRECLPTSLPACLPAGGVRPGLKRTGTINVRLDVFHVLLCYLSACVRWALVFA